MISEHYVYALLDSSKPGEYTYGGYTFSHEPFYVGKGKANRIKDTLYDKNSFKAKKIRKMREEGVEIITQKVLESLSNEESILKEVELISTIGRRDRGMGPLVNTTDGGEGRSGSPHSEDTKARISRGRKGIGVGRKHRQETIDKFRQAQSGEMNGFYGKRHTEEVKARHSQRVSGSSHPMFGKKHSAEVRERIARNRKDRVSQDAIRGAALRMSKPVLMYDLSLDFLGEFESVKAASEGTGINESIISKCCRGEIKSPTRYYFRYKNREDRVKKNKFLVDVGGRFWLRGREHTLIKRNMVTCIVEVGGEHITLHERDHAFLFGKDTIDIDAVELYLFLSGLDPRFRMRGGTIRNGKIEVRLVKIDKNTEVLVGPGHGHMAEAPGDGRVVYVFSDEWESKRDIVKSRLRHMLGMSDKVWARKCEVRVVEDNALVRSFLRENHIQGYVGSVHKLGLFHDGELVSLMTFGNLRKSMGQKAGEGAFELLRFCNRLGTSVVGGASRLFRHFLGSHSVDQVISYADKRWSDGGLYRSLGFTLAGETVPNYFYIINGRREYRFRWRKDILVGMGHSPEKTEVEIMHGLGHYRIFDRGSMKFIYNNK